MSSWKHITVFDREYSVEKQTEGIAVQMVVAEGYCEKCGFLSKCCADDSFLPPVFAWCSQKKHEILKEWGQSSGDENGSSVSGS